MDKYAGVQNPQLYQQLLEEEERKKRAREAQNRTSSSNFYSAMHNMGSGQSAQASPPSGQMTPEQRQAAFDLMSKTSSTNLYSNLYSKVLASNAGSGAKAPEPAKKKSEKDVGSSKEKEKQTYRLPGVAGYTWKSFSRGDGTSYTVKVPIYEAGYDPMKKELTEEELEALAMRAFNARNNVTSSNQFNYYNDALFGQRYQLEMPEGYASAPKVQPGRGENGDQMLGDPTQEQIDDFLKATRDAGIWTEPGMELNEYGAYDGGPASLEPALQIEQEYYQREAEKIYASMAPNVEQMPATTNAIVDEYAASGQGNDVIDYETITDIHYGYAEPGAYERLTAEQKRAYDSWTKLAEIHDMVDSYIRMYGERGIFTERYLRQLNMQMDSIVKYDPDMGQRFWYGVTEFFAGIGGFVESTLRFVGGVAFGVIGGAAYVLGSKEAAGEWFDTSREIMGGSDIEKWRQSNQEKFTITPRDQSAVNWAYSAGNIVPSLLLTAATGGLSAASVVSVANTWQQGTRQALQGGADYGTALLYGGALGAMDATVSALTGGFGNTFKVGKKVFEFGTDVLAKKAAGFLCKSEAGKYWVKLGLTALMEQPLDLMAMTASPLLQRAMYDPDAELYTANQIGSAALQGFLARGLMELAKDVPQFLKSIDGGKSLVDANATLPEDLKRKIDGKYEAALENAQAGTRTAAEADPELALRQMDANTKNALDAQGLDVPDATKQLADVLAMDADIDGGAERVMKTGTEVSDIDITTVKTGTEIGQAQATGDLTIADVLAKELGAQNSTGKVDTNSDGSAIIRYESSAEIPKEVQSGKPKNSPTFERWYELGGKIEYDGKTRNFTYIDANGYAVTYKGASGKYPDFEDVKLNGEPVNVCGKKVELDGFTTRQKDKAIAEKQVGKCPEGYVWHHKEDGYTLIQVDNEIHTRFTHKGGHSMYGRK